MLDDAPPQYAAQAGDKAQAQPYSWFGVNVFERTVHLAVHHIDRPYFDAVAAPILNMLAGEIEPQWLTVEHGRKECGWLMALDPAADIDR